MKLAWLCYRNDGWYREEDIVPQIVFYEPDPNLWDKVIPIVYAILEK